MKSFVVLGHDGATRTAKAGCAVVACLAAAACTGDFSILQPEGPVAARVAHLWWVMLAGAFAILFGVTAVALYALKRRRRGFDVSERTMLVGWGLVFPVVTLALLMGWAFLRGEQLLARPDAGVLTVRVHAVQWAWHASYPGGERTVNAIHVPAGVPFHVEVTSGDVIHSFWVPRLGGKIDAIPGKVNRIALQADRPGLYRGLCAEYCGLGHAHMLLVLHAHPAEDYAGALAAAAAQPPPADMPEVLEPRRTPADNILRAWADYLLEYVGLR
ncbi:MAG TPA: cytochrome c oxidase subunit II [Sphingomicrobium sp.]|nr:cytochrome c oxidase subunit II [Sphingomicrobium sp.]